MINEWHVIRDELHEELNMFIPVYEGNDTNFGAEIHHRKKSLSFPHYRNNAENYS